MTAGVAVGPQPAVVVAHDDDRDPAEFERPVVPVRRPGVGAADADPPPTKDRRLLEGVDLRVGVAGGRKRGRLAGGSTAGRQVVSEALRELR